MVISCSYLLGQTSWSHLKTTRALMDVRRVQEWGLNKNRLLNFWQWYTHEFLVYYYICRMAIKSENWNCMCRRLFSADLVTCGSSHCKKSSARSIRPENSRYNDRFWIIFSLIQECGAVAYVKHPVRTPISLSCKKRNCYLRNHCTTLHLDKLKLITTLWWYAL